MSQTEPDVAPTCPFTDASRLFEDFDTARATPGLAHSTTMNRRIVSRYDEIIEALHTPDIFSSKPVVPVLPSPWREKFEGKVPDRGTLIGHDNPTHDRLRAAVNTFFVPRRLARFEPWIERTAHELMDSFCDRGAAEFKRAFALPMPLRTIAHIVGLDESRAEWIGLALSFFMGPKDPHYTGTPPEEKAQALLDLHEYVLQIMEERRVDRRDDLISHVWNVRDSGDVEMTDWEMLSLFPGLMLAGHETTSNLICMALSHLLGHPGAYEKAQADDAARSRALEELLRFESAITGMPRVVTQDTVLGDTALRAGDEVFLAYASGSRDEAVFAEGDALNFERTFDLPHLGFGQGIHACIGAPLARLLLKVELRVIQQRLPGLRLARPYEQRVYGEVGEGRGMPNLELEWDADVAMANRIRGRHTSGSVAAGPDIHHLQVEHLREVADDVVELTLRSSSGDLPSWSPGAHVDLDFDNGLTRSYSLVGHPSHTNAWKVAVLREPSGSGGSEFVHSSLREGDRIKATGPRNHFAFDPSGTAVFIAGGIGITPVIPMICEIAQRGGDWRLIYLGRERTRMAYLPMLEALGGDRVTAWPADERGRFDVDCLFAELDGSSTVYCCGPERLLSAVESAGDDRGLRVEVERFAPRPRTGDVDSPFTVTLGRSGRDIAVSADETMLDALNRHGCAIMSTCREGTCGTCEVRVLAGSVDHRDSVLTRDEQASGEYMMTCVSRAAMDRITVDL